MSVATMPWSVTGWERGGRGGGRGGGGARSAKNKGRRSARQRADAQQSAQVDELANAHAIVQQAARSLGAHLEQEATRWGQVDQMLEAVARMPGAQDAQSRALTAMREQMRKQQAGQDELTQAIEQAGTGLSEQGERLSWVEREVVEGPMGQLAARLDVGALTPALERLSTDAVRQRELLERLAARQVQMQHTMQEACESAQRQMMTVIVMGWLMLVLGAGLAGTAGLALAQAG